MRPQPEPPRLLLDRMLAEALPLPHNLRAFLRVEPPHIGFVREIELVVRRRSDVRASALAQSNDEMTPEKAGSARDENALAG